MTDLTTLLQTGNAWLFVPSAILLGALHGLEPGHSKTMMAAFIIAVRGTLLQAVLLGLAATISHTAVVWIIALAGLHFGAQWNTGATEPYLQLVSAVLIVGVAAWMVWRTWRDTHVSAHTHEHGSEAQTVDTGHGVVTLGIFEDGVPPRWQVRFPDGHGFAADAVSLETVRPDGSRQSFAFAAGADGLISTSDIPEPHAFKATLSLGHAGHVHRYTLEFAEDGHTHDHSGSVAGGLGADDAHARAHADDIARRFAGRNVTTGQIVLFGLTGGLIPCPASITVLLLCLQLKQFTLGVALVLCFSLGLALTMVSVGAAAALSVHHIARRWDGFERLAQRAPYLSGLLIVCVGLYAGYLGYAGLAQAAH